MKVYVFSKQREIADIISDHLSDTGNLCFSFHKQDDIKQIIQKTDDWPGLFIVDYMSYNHDLYDIYHFFERRRYHIPVVMYNDPCLIKQTRLEHWFYILEKKQNYYLKMDLEILRPLLTALEELIEAQEFKPYVSLLQPAKPVPQELIHNPFTLHYIRGLSNDCIYEFRNKIHLSDSLFYLLSILQSNKSEPMTLEEILQVYKKDNKQMTANSLKVVISRLRRKIRENPDCGFLINHTDNKYRFVRYK